MNAVSILQTYVVPESFDRALKSVRGALHEVELDILCELPVEGPNHPRIVMVSCPILDFEAVALGRSAAVFFPLHLLLSGEQGHTRVSVVNPAALFDGRLPIGASGPMDRLVARVAMALDSVAKCAALPPG